MAQNNVQPELEALLGLEFRAQRVSSVSMVLRIKGFRGVRVSGFQDSPKHPP